VFKVSPKDRRR